MPNTNHDVSSAVSDLMEFLAPTQTRADLKYEAVKVVSRGMADRTQALGLVEAGVLKPVLRIASGASQAIEDSSSSSSSSSGDGKRNLLLELAASTLALQTLLYATSAAEELANAVVDRLLDAKAVGRLVELILDLPTDASRLTKSSKKIVNTALAVLANLTRTEKGALELVGTTLPDEAVYNNSTPAATDDDELPRIEELSDDGDDDGTSTNPSGAAGEKNDDDDRHVRIKASMELLLDRFLRNRPNPAERKDVDLSLLEPDEWDAALCVSDPYQHFAALLMNATQVKAGRKFATRIPRASTTSGGDPAAEQRPKSVLQKLLPVLREKTEASNPFRRRGIAGMVRNCCLDTKENAWWLLNICEVLTPLLMPLMGPEELDLDDKKGMDPDLWLDGPDRVRDHDAITRLYCVESVLALLATGRASRKTIRLARTYTVLKTCDLAESSEEVSEKIGECVNFLRRDEAGTAEGSSDNQVYGEDDDEDDGKDGTGGGGGGRIAGLLTASASTTIAPPPSDEEFDGVD
eukprot:CAMPEP_0197180960 /NCGR_PEP_ID=MMETSP1423-20130617/5382_1 /TAXON_ID=476441 /ORGANISM="Pseudo-nitzschia heimii, Strain UNC1101" /LENGTH=522 /DNA_ID=CAMNT_0042631109 /DNA_START=91 /DNA_END=1659 /DNA_ORIENTATION=+